MNPSDLLTMSDDCDILSLHALIQKRLGRERVSPSTEKKAEAEVCQAILQAESVHTVENLNCTSYLRARNHNGGLVRIESPIGKFSPKLPINGDNDDGDDNKVHLLETAKALEKYWSFRCKAFGETQWLKPMTLTKTGKSAISPKDMEVFDSGFFVMLPPDNKGRNVVCYDRSRLAQDFSDSDLTRLLPSVLRCMFYVISMAVMGDFSHQDGDDHDHPPASTTTGRCAGIVVLQSYSSSFRPIPAFDNAFLEGLYGCLSSMPIDSWHSVVAFRLPRKQNEEYRNVTIPHLEASLKHHRDPYVLISHSHIAELLRMVSNQGFDAKGIPKSLGGSWIYFKDFQEWRRDRVITEELIEALVTVKDSAAAASSATTILQKHKSKQRKRALDVQYARRKRAKGRETAYTLKMQISNSQTRAFNLKKEHKRLLTLLEAAHAVLENLGLNAGYAMLPSSRISCADATPTGIMNALIPTLLRDTRSIRAAAHHQQHAVVAADHHHLQALLMAAESASSSATAPAATLATSLSLLSSHPNSSNFAGMCHPGSNINAAVMHDTIMRAAACRRQRDIQQQFHHLRTPATARTPIDNIYVLYHAMGLEPPMHRPLLTQAAPFSSSQSSSPSLAGLLPVQLPDMYSAADILATRNHQTATNLRALANIGNAIRSTMMHNQGDQDMFSRQQQR